MILHCPCCHAQFPIEALTQDEAARELLAMRPAMLPSLLPYLTLFRTGKRPLAFDQALKLAKEAAALCDDPGRLEAALAATVDGIRAKREEGGTGKPMKNHNYLKKVLADMPATSAVRSPRGDVNLPARPAAPSRTMEALDRLDSWGGDE